MFVLVVCEASLLVLIPNIRNDVKGVFLVLDGVGGVGCASDRDGVKAYIHVLQVVGAYVAVCCGKQKVLLFQVDGEVGISERGGRTSLYLHDKDGCHVFVNADKVQFLVPEGPVAMAYVPSFGAKIFRGYIFAPFSDVVV